MTMDPTHQSPDPESRPSQSRPQARGLFQALAGVLVLLAAAGLAWYLLSSSGGVGRHAETSRAPRLVEIETARAGTHRPSVTAWGTVSPARAISLTPRVGGRVSFVSDTLEPGSVIEAGQEIVRVDSEDFELAVEQARGSVIQARAELALEQGQQAVAKREFELLGGMVDEVQKGLILRQPQLNAARAVLSSAEAELAEAQLALERTRITTPFDALVLSRSVAPGQEVGTGTVLAELAGIYTWWVELAVPVDSLRWLTLPEGEAPGSSVRLYYDGVWPEGSYREGRLIRLLGQVEENGRMARVLVAVDSPLSPKRNGTITGRLLLGAFMRAEIPGRPLQDSVALKPAWLRADNTVWLMDENDQLRIRKVVVAYRDNERVLVTEGINAGDRIVTSRMSIISEGMPLRVQEVKTPDAASGQEIDHEA